jgi:ribosome recycling factor
LIKIRSESMNREETKELIKVMQAYVDGEKIEIQSGGTNSDWKECAHPNWNFAIARYRIKPKPRIIWVNEYPHDICAHVSKDRACFNATRSDVVGIAVPYRELTEEEREEAGI